MELKRLKKYVGKKMIRKIRILNCMAKCLSYSQLERYTGNNEVKEILRRC